MSGPTGSVPPPAGLRERVLARSLGLRPAGRATPEPEPISELEAFRRTADSLTALLDSLTDQQWRRPALRGLDVQGLIGHLIGVEEHVQRALAGDRSVAQADHVASSQTRADRQSGQPVQATRGTWVSAVSGTLALIAVADQDATLALYGARLPVSDVSIARTFELWTHENDIRQALELPESRPDASTLTLMTTLAAGLLPRAAAARGLTGGLTLRLVLTGPGGGTWQLALGGQGPTSTAVGIVTDAVAFCRLVANRAAPTELDIHVTGDPKPVAAILHAATTLALD
jgi:uncharacterized protein (TIGR03083 family)